MVSKRVWEAHKKSVVAVMLFVIGVMLCSCHVLSKSDLIKYARSNYGDCTFVREEHKGSGNDAVRTVYLEDKETGIEYTVTSRMTSINIDGSNFGYQEDTSSDFEQLYYSYLLDEAEYDLSKLESKYSMNYSFEHYIFKITFDDRDSGEKAKQCLDMSHVDGLMIGRAAIGNPWIFNQIKAYLKDGSIIGPPSIEQRVEMCRRHILMSVDYKGEKRSILEMRHHYGCYFRAIRNFKPFKMELMKAMSADELMKILDKIISANS